MPCHAAPYHATPRLTTPRHTTPRRALGEIEDLDKNELRLAFNAFIDLMRLVDLNEQKSCSTESTPASMPTPTPTPKPTVKAEEAVVESAWLSLEDEEAATEAANETEEAAKVKVAAKSAEASDLAKSTSKSKTTRGLASHMRKQSHDKQGEVRSKRGEVISGGCVECDWCGLRCNGWQGVNGHKNACPARPAGLVSRRGQRYREETDSEEEAEEAEAEEEAEEAEEGEEEEEEEEEEEDEDEDEWEKGQKKFACLWCGKPLKREGDPSHTKFCLARPQQEKAAEAVAVVKKPVAVADGAGSSSSKGAGSSSKRGKAPKKPLRKGGKPKPRRKAQGTHIVNSSIVTSAWVRDEEWEEEEDEEVVELRRAMEEEGWSFSLEADPAVGKLVRRFFRSRLTKTYEAGRYTNQKKRKNYKAGNRQIQQTVDGRVIAFIPQDGDDEALWKIQHHDGTLR